MPGGNRAPFAIVREGHPSVLWVGEATLPVVRRAYELADAGLTDCQVARLVGLAPLRLRGAGCSRFLYGDTGRYRHPAPTCPEFLRRRPSLPMEWACRTGA